MRSVGIIFLVLGCLLNQASYQALPAAADGDGARILAAQYAPTDVLLRSPDRASLAKIAEALLIVYLVPQAGTMPFGRAADMSDGRTRELRPTLQTLDVRQQV